MKLLKNKSFQKALKNAGKVASNPEKISELISSVTEKISGMDGNKVRINEFMFKVKTFLRLLRAYINGDYTETPWKSILMIVGSLLYFLMPLDFIPDFIPVMGFADDISILFLVFNMINEDVEDFLEFEKSRETQVSHQDK